ncbi:MAG: alanine dehydrogenase [Myxococcales bacterium]|nr:alanine dehydrogenase [Myxococcales bacterium]MDD9968915.1 alanine dehydrogenase [Myxococcales bacterium]
MRIGVPREIKAQEFRVGATPACVTGYVADGHEVLVESAAGEGAGFSDAAYVAAGAHVTKDAGETWAQDMVIKVKEPLPAEYPYLRQDQLLFTYLHLAAVPALADALMQAGTSAIAYETVEGQSGEFVCLSPMSAIAGRLSIQQGAKYLERPFGGRGVLLGGVPGVPRGHVIILGGGVVGTQAARMAVGLGADVTILDVSPRRLADLEELFGGRVQTLFATADNLATCLCRADLVVGAVLVPGAAAPKLIRREHLGLMQSGALIVDVAVDQGGCVETTQPTSHVEPVFTVDGIQHYCVANMPSAVARTATQALVSVTTPYGRRLAGQGLLAAIAADPGLERGLNVHAGGVTHPAVARALGVPQRPLAA